MRRETQNPLISSQILSPFAEQSSLAIAIFVHIGIGKVGKLFSNQGNPLQKSGFPAVGKKLPVLFQFLYRGM
jgi:hypothetical protein